MIYTSEPVYFTRRLYPPHLVPLERAVLVTAETIARWCVRFEAGLIIPKLKGQTEKDRSGKLPDNLEEREAFIEELCQWLFEHSLTPDLFKFFLYSSDSIAIGEIAPFDHHDDTCCWALNLTPLQFTELQNAWEQASLPRDLFYETSKTVCEVSPPGPIGRFFRWFGFSFENKRCYSPKEWELKSK
jgi:hypothetical protein